MSTSTEKDLEHQEDLAKRPPAQDPNVIGYWARMNNLDINDCLEIPKIEAFVSGFLSEFHAGWNEADEEIKQGKFEKLFRNLRDLEGGEIWNTP